MPTGSQSSRRTRLGVVALHSRLAGPFDLALDAGECLAITGVSGSGKSLFLRMVADLDPNQGQVFLDSIERRSLPAHEWRRRVVYSAAEPGWWHERVADHFHGAAIDFARATAPRLALSPALLDGEVVQLSTGERQRMALLRALALRSPVLLLDEPTGALDEASTTLVEDVLRERLVDRRHHRHGDPQCRAGGAAGPPASAHGRSSPGAGMNPILLTPFDVAIAAVLIVLDGVLSLLLRLGLHTQLAWAATRLVVQLVLIGFVLRLVFAIASPPVTLAVILVMVAIAGREVAARPEQRLGRFGNYAVGASAVAFATFLTAILALTTAIRPQPWYDARYAIPLAGIILGSVLNGGSLALDSLLGGVVRERAAIEAQLALGASFSHAMRGLIRASVRRALLPIINQMSAAGVVTLPGIMTGQILAGMDPMEAAKYQILLIFLLSGGSGLAAVAVVYLAAMRLTDDRQRLRIDRLTARARGSRP